MRYLFIFLFASSFCLGQDTLMLAMPLPEIVFEEEKSENERVFTPQKIESITATSIFSSSPNNTADILEKSGNISIQKSQGGGGSPIIRGFEANRVLLVVDGVRLNNAIYRSGHVQSIITTSPFMLEKIDLIFGPASVKYGSDALGGVVHLHTRSPKINTKTIRRLVQKYNSSNNGVTSHFDIVWSHKKWSFLNGFTLSKFENQKMGTNRYHGYEGWGLESHIVDGNEQLRTGYSQADFINKIRLEYNEYLSVLLNTQFSTSSNIGRFDKLNDMTDSGSPKYETWEYGPQKRILSSLSVNYKKKNLFFDELNILFSGQYVKEHRISQKLNSNKINRLENVWVYSINNSYLKTIGKLKINYGLDVQYNYVESKVYGSNAARYADGGSKMINYGLFGQVKKPFSNIFHFGGGLRFSSSYLDAKYLNTEEYGLPFTNIDLNNSSLTGGIGLGFNFDKWEGSFNVSSGFRSPNVDDVTKVFSKNNTVTVPNDKLLPEYSYTGDFLIKKYIYGNSYVESSIYYTWLKQAIVKDRFRLNNSDSLIYDGELLPIVANQNIQSAIVYGYNIRAKFYLSKDITTSHSFNYTFGKDVDKNTYLDHIPPKTGRSDIKWSLANFSSKLYFLYSSNKKASLYSINGSDNLDEATENGLPFWWTANMSFEFNLSEYLNFTCGLENIFDAHYKTYSSGISSPGRSVIFSVLAEF